MTIPQKRKGYRANQKRIQKDVKKRMYHKDNSASYRSYKQARQSYREEYEEWV